jgi:hypothetical protein
MTRSYVEITRLAPFREEIFGELIAEDGKVFCVATANGRKMVELNIYYQVKYIKTIVGEA